MPKKVTYVQLREGFFLPNVKNGNIASTLPAEGKTMEKLEMTLHDSGHVELTWVENERTLNFTIPANNIKVVGHPTIEKAKPTAK